jgi:pyridoxine 5-phosphate synthase
VKKSSSQIRLGVNIDHVATLRQVRGGTTPYPNLEFFMKEAVAGGAEQITIHLREDRRHIQLSDLIQLSQNRLVPLNLEMAATATMLKYALKYKPDWVCFVPEKREELTTEGGLNVEKGASVIAPMVERMGRIGIETSMFIAPSLKQVKASHKIGADAIELHTGHWVAYAGKKRKDEWKRLCEAAEYAHELGMNVHAGHGLDYLSTAEICKLPYLQELNIGHSLVCYALESGLKKSVRQMRKVIAEHTP